MWNYERIKREAEASGRRVSEYQAMSSTKDPFYFGQPAQRKKAEWCARYYHEMGFDQQGTQVHLRRMHYAFASKKFPLPEAEAHARGPKSKLSGTLYDNTEECWQYLLCAAQAARYLKLIPFEAIVDNRNAKPTCYIVDEEQPSLETVSYLTLGPHPPNYRLAGYSALQPFHLEIWCEKTTQDDILLPLAEEYQINMQSGAGEASITGVREMALRIKKSGKPARVFCISDFDPDGQDMPVSFGRKLDWFLQDEGVKQDVRLFPLVLTYEQTEAYRLLRTDRAYPKTWVDRFGDGGVELDALEALHPGELERIVRSAIEHYYDVTLKKRTADAQQELERELEHQRRALLAAHQKELDSLQAMYDKMEQEHQRLSRMINEELRDAQPDLDNFPRPEARPSIGLDDALFDSTRDFLEQVAIFKQFQGKDQQMEGAA